MKYLFLILLLTSTALAERYPRTGTGIEAGVSSISSKKGHALGTSWAWHVEYRPDKFAGFFGHAGQNSGDDKGKLIQQNFFAGGGELALLPVLDLRLGLMESVSAGKNEVGPLVGLSVSERSGVWRPGITLEVTRTNSVHTLALRGIFYFDL